MKTKVLLYHRGRLTGKSYIESRPCKSIEKAKVIADKSLAVAAEFINNGKKVQIK
jgi:hypothetical protein